MHESTIKRIELGIFIIAIFVALIWAGRGTDVSIGKFITGIGSAKQFLISLFPPNFRIIPKITPRIIETLQMAIVSIILSSMIAIPVSFLAAKNTSPNQIVYRITRTILNLIRSVPTLLYALLFISMVGLGPYPGVIGLTIHCVGTLGKYFSEAIENINPGIIDAGKSTGATKTQIIMYAMIPELKPLFLGYIFYYFEYCVRTSTVMGVVGAGGIGMELLTNIRLFRNQEALAILIVMILIVTIIDSVSYYIRKRIIGFAR